MFSHITLEQIWNGGQDNAFIDYQFATEHKVTLLMAQNKYYLVVMD